MSESNSSSSMGCTDLFIVLLTVLFIGLKLTGHVDWSWWWVLSPLWIGVALIFSIFILGLVCCGILFIAGITIVGNLRR